jgi:predicted lipoprotein with Yx(FWY)xxD motif
MNRRLIFGGMVAAAVLGATGVGVSVAGSGSGAPSHPAYGPPAAGAYGPPPAASKPAATVTVARTGLGQTLVDGGGRTLYIFEADNTKGSTCYGSCTSAWPPATVAAAPRATGAAAAALLGTLRRTDGTTQLTYHGHPLYYYAGDTGPGDTTGQGLLQFGAKWYVLNPGGDKIDND